MKIVLFTIGLACAGTAFSQEEDESLSAPSRDGGNTVYYELLYDKPEDFRMASLMLPLWNLAGSKINSSIYDLNAGGFYYDGKFQGFLRYKWGVGDKIAPETYEFMDYSSQPLMFSINEVPKSQELNLVGTYFFSNRGEQVKETIKLKQSGKVVTVTEIPATALLSMGINLGYAQGFTWYSMNNTTVTAITRDGAEQTVNLGSMSSIQTYKFLKVGLTFSKAINVKGNFQGYGERTSAHLRTTWVNLICAMQNQFDDVYIPADAGANDDYDMSNIQHVTKASIDGSNKKLPVGIEFGQRFTEKKGIISYEYGIKYLPGFMNNINLMVDVGVNFNINFMRNR